MLTTKIIYTTEQLAILHEAIAEALQSEQWSPKERSVLADLLTHMALDVIWTSDPPDLETQITDARRQVRVEFERELAALRAEIAELREENKDLAADLDWYIQQEAGESY